MSIRYRLDLWREIRAVAYSNRRKVSLELEALVRRHHLVHDDMIAADLAAKAISANALIDKVTVTRVEESRSLIYRNGERLMQLVHTGESK